MYKALFADIFGVKNQTFNTMTIEETQELTVEEASDFLTASPRFYIRSYGPPSIGGVKLDTVWSVYSDGCAVGSFGSLGAAEAALEFLNSLNSDFTFHETLIALERFKNDDHFNPETIYRRE